MAKFNIKQYGDNLIDHTFMKLEHVVYNIEYKVFLAMAECAANVERARKSQAFNSSNPIWENRTWNLVSSFYMMFLYNGKLVGVETTGALEKSEEWIRKSGKWNSKRRKGVKVRTKGYNPVFSYTYTKKGEAEWRNDNLEHYPFYGGKAYANYAVEKVKGRNRKKGYVVCFGFAMPYATSPKGFMKDRTSIVLMWLFNELFKQKMAEIGIPAYYKQIDGNFLSKAIS